MQPPTWRSTPALRRAMMVAVLAGLAAVSFGQPALALLAVPFAVGTAWSLAARPDGVPEATLRIDNETTVEGGPTGARVSVRNDTGLPLLCVVSARVSPWIRLQHGAGHYAALLLPSGTTSVRLEGSLHRWGRQQIGPVRVHSVACDGMLAVPGQQIAGQPVTVLPRSEIFDSGQDLPLAAGVVGIHSSRRLGDSADLAEVRQFQAGDRLRRINWRVTTRTNEVYVNATQSDRDADVVLLLDARREAGESGGVDGRASLQDVTIRAAAGLLEHYAHQGDRVALAEFGPRPRTLPAGSGRRHYLAALDWLIDIADLATNPSGAWPVERLLGSGLLPPRATVIMLTPLLDYESAFGLAVLARSGRPLIAVDVLARDLRPEHTGRWSGVSERLWRVERANTVERLHEAGVPVERWQGAGSLDAVLRHVHRMSTAGKGSRR